MLLGLMERFSYPSLAAARAESAEILRLLEIERAGTPPRTEGDGEGGWSADAG